MQHTPPRKLAFSVAEACAALGLGKTNFYRLVADGTIETVKIGGRRLVPVASLEVLLDGNAPFAGRIKTYDER